MTLPSVTWPTASPAHYRPAVDPYLSVPSTGRPVTGRVRDAYQELFRAIQERLGSPQDAVLFTDRPLGGTKLETSPGLGRMILNLLFGKPREIDPFALEAWERLDASTRWELEAVAQKVVDLGERPDRVRAFLIDRVWRSPAYKTRETGYSVANQKAVRPRKYANRTKKAKKAKRATAKKAPRRN